VVAMLKLDGISLRSKPCGGHADFSTRTSGQQGSFLAILRGAPQSRREMIMAPSGLTPISFGLRAARVGCPANPHYMVRPSPVTWGLDGGRTLNGTTNACRMA
jgi:hypothetical protein